MRLIRTLVPVGLLLVGLGELSAQSSADDPLPTRSDNRVAYRIDVTLSEDAHAVKGICRATWRNREDAPTQELLFHLYPNAFRDRGSVWMREAVLHGRLDEPRGWEDGTSDYGLAIGHDKEGEAPSKAIRLSDGTPLSYSYLASNEHPDDRTVLRVALPTAVPPGGEVTVEIDFITRFPPAFRRNGFGSDGYLMAAQWYPKLGVFEARSGAWGWNCEPYHFLTEFYSDYGTYTLVLRVPGRYVEAVDDDFVVKVGATGSLVGIRPPTVDGWRELEFYAEDVHDFAWVADPNFLVEKRPFQQAEWANKAEEEEVARLLGRSTTDLRLLPVEIILLLQPEHAELADRYFDAAAKSLYYFGLWYGRYPYETLTVVDPAHDARWTGGMEYPRLITCGTRLGRPERVLGQEGLTVHEFGHQYWYGLVGNDEVQAAWLDEGFNSYSTARVMRLAYGKAWDSYEVANRHYYGTPPLQMPSSSGDARAILSLSRWETPELGFVPPISAPLLRENSLLRFLRELPLVTYLPPLAKDKGWGMRYTFDTDLADPIAAPSWDHFSHRDYRANSYPRTALTLFTMEGLAGEARWARTMRAYHERWRFGHPQPADFLAVVEQNAAGSEVGGIPVDWIQFWRQAFLENRELDYGVSRLENRENEDGSWDVVLELRRWGNFRVPVEVEIQFEGEAAPIRIAWDGQESWRREQWPANASRILSVTVDPDRRLALDRNWTNNSRLADPDPDVARGYGWRLLLWAQQVLHYYGGIG